MRKIPTLFVRDVASGLRFVRDEVHPDCSWVTTGEGVATRKLDGTCMRVADDGSLWKRREIKPSQDPPADFVLADADPVTGKRVGWVPVGDGRDDRFAREAWDHLLDEGRRFAGKRHDPASLSGTYELIGPRINGNPEGFDRHSLVAHDDPTLVLSGVPRDFDGLRTLLTDPSFHFEGVVWHHPDGRMVKLKRRDFPAPS